ncbi:hypothetical protein DFH09DRAFT_1094948 [Mycena vulgaris]|nr:hypothetical protein DFH09DRAFT_1094948 [Mycena vulgaris]
MAEEWSNLMEDATVSLKIALIVEQKTNLCYGRVSTGRRVGNRPVVKETKWPTERARHPCHGCRRTVATVMGGSPKLELMMALGMTDTEAAFNEISSRTDSCTFSFKSTGGASEASEA